MSRKSKALKFAYEHQGNRAYVNARSIRGTGTSARRAYLLKSHFNYSKKDKAIMRSYNQNAWDTSISIFGVVFVILFMFSFLGALYGNETDFSFRSLLDCLTSAPAIDISGVAGFSSELCIVDDWGIFNWFRDFINNFFLSICSVAIYFSVSLMQLLIYICYFVGFIFTGGW